MERFPFLFLGHTVPEAQTWFWLHPCMCATFMCLFTTQVKGNKTATDWGMHSLSWRGVRQPHLGFVQSACGGCNRLGHTWSGGNPSQCLWRRGLVCGGDSGPHPLWTSQQSVLFPRQTTVPLGTFLPMVHLTLVPSVVSLQPTTFLSPDPLS